MLKLRKFKEKKLTNKNIMVSFVTIIVLLITLVFSKSYAIYKMQKEFDVIKSQIGTFTNGDVKVAVLVDGKETNEFPSYETNYKIESVECTNGVTGSFDVENWQVTIADMKATSTKCTVSFNSNETNEITPINMSKKDLIALNEEYQNVAYNNLKTQLLNDTYPVGSIYMSTEDDTVEKVQNKFGGTWVKYAEDMTLVGASSSKAVNTTGGSSTVALTTDNLPSHSHSFTPTGSVSSSFTGSSVSTSTTGNHNHTGSGKTSTNGAHTHTITSSNGQIWTDEAGSHGSSPIRYAPTTDLSLKSNAIYAASAGNHDHTYNFTTSTTGNHSHTVTAKGSVSSSFKGTAGTTGSTGKGTSFSVQNPYISVYMYKRTA